MLQKFKFCLSLAFLAISHSNAISIDLERLCIDEILNAISNNTTCTDITAYFLDRVHKYNPEINAFITIDDTGALESARRLDRYYAMHGKIIGKLHCVPALIKDNIAVEGLPLTLGLEMFRNSTVSLDAPSVRKLRDAGAVILGKANMAPMAIGIPDEASCSGVVHNPYSLDHFSSGSSNGNAVALAARLVVIGLGSDTSGSTTAPAMVTHVVDLRPAINSFDMSGLFPCEGPEIDTIGLMALKVEDIFTLMQVLSDQNQDFCNDTQDQLIKIGVLGNLTYGSMNYHSIDLEVLPVFRRFHEKLTMLPNVTVNVTWDDRFETASTRASREMDARTFEESSACNCTLMWTRRFLDTYQMMTNETRILDLKELVRHMPGKSKYWSFWFQVLYRCANTGSPDHCTAEDIATEKNHINSIRKLLGDTLFMDYDILISTDNPHAVASSTPRSFGVSSMPGYGFMPNFESTSAGDLASMFSNPALALPIGFTEISLLKWDSLPVTAYLTSMPEKFPLMLELARRYERSYWNPKIPFNFTD